MLIVAATASAQDSTNELLSLAVEADNHRNNNLERTGGIERDGIS